jgi:hypothetical protein
VIAQRLPSDSTSTAKRFLETIYIRKQKIIESGPNIDQFKIRAERESKTKRLCIIECIIYLVGADLIRLEFELSTTQSTPLPHRGEDLKLMIV